MIFCSICHILNLSDRWEADNTYGSIIEELREKYIKNPPEGMTPTLVRNMSNSDLLDMHYFLTEDDDFDGEEEGFYINLF